MWSSKWLACESSTKARKKGPGCFSCMKVSRCIRSAVRQQHESAPAFNVCSTNPGEQLARSSPPAGAPTMQPPTAAKLVTFPWCGCDSGLHFASKERNNQQSFDPTIRSAEGGSRVSCPTVLCFFEERVDPAMIPGHRAQRLHVTQHAPNHSRHTCKQTRANVRTADV